MPALDGLNPLHLSLRHSIWMMVLRGYLVVAAVMVIFRVIKLLLAQH